MWPPKKQIVCPNGCKTKYLVLEQIKKYHVDHYGEKIEEIASDDWENNYFCPDCKNQIWPDDDEDEPEYNAN